MKLFKRKKDLIKALTEISELNKLINEKAIIINSLNNKVITQYEKIANLEYKNQELTKLLKEALELAIEQNARTKVSMN